MLTARESLENKILRLLAVKAERSARQIHDQLKDYSIQGVHKELRKLQALGVVVKQGDRFSLSLLWVLELTALADQMYESHTRGLGNDLLPRSGERKRFKFSRLNLVDDFWVQLLILMLSRSSNGIIYQWLPHPWFHLISGFSTHIFYTGLKNSGYHVSSIIGGRTWLDRDSESKTVKGAYDFHYRKGPFDNEEGKYYSSSENYLITVIPDAKTTSAIETLYRSVHSPKDLQKFSSLLVGPHKISVTVECDTSRSHAMWKKFKDFFEVTPGKTRGKTGL